MIFGTKVVFFFRDFQRSGDESMSHGSRRLNHLVVEFHEPPFNPWKNTGFGHLKTRLFTIKTCRFGGPMVVCSGWWVLTGYTP